MRYILGLDMGIASIGWCILDCDRNRIENLGVRTFVAAENPKDGKSLAEPRRIARSMRRRIRRRAHRMKRLRGLLVQQGIIPKENVDDFFSTCVSDPYYLRAKGLDDLLTNEEWARVLLHIAKRRGFKSNRKSEEQDKEGGQVLSSIKDKLAIMAENKFRTVGEMLYKDLRFSDTKRNKGGLYSHTLSRAMLEQELKFLFEAQRNCGNLYASKAFEESFCQIFLSQRPFASKDDISKMVGHCTFESDQLRAPKHSFTAERFVLLQKINNIKILTGGGRTGLTADQRAIVASMAYEIKEVKYSQIRKALDLPMETQFVGLSYFHNNESKNPEDARFISLDGFHKLKKAITDHLGKTAWGNVRENIDLLDDFGCALTFYKTDADIVEFLTAKMVDAEYIQAVLAVSFDKVQHLSVKAMRKIIPFLEQGMTYGDACENAGYCHWAPKDSTAKKTLLPVITKAEMRNPVVLRALAQSRKIINAIIRQYGSPYRIHVEVARELAKPWQERKEIERGQKNYQQLKEQWRNDFISFFGFNPKSEDLLKYRLWREQSNFCAYSVEYLDPSRLLEPGYAEIDHILPYSRSLDDSMANKALVKGVENRNKGNRTPFEYFGSDEVRWHRFEEWVKANIRNAAKRNRLLRENYNAKEEEEMKARNLNDTRYISRYLSQLLKEHIAFNNTDQKNPVLMVNGQMTAFLRARWGLLKVREDGDLHHALDAAVVAATSTEMVHKISRYSKANELRYQKINGKYIDIGTGEIMSGPYNETIDTKHFPQPWEQFREELVARLSDAPEKFLHDFGIPSYNKEELNDVRPVFVSRASTRKVSGPAHEDTIRSKKLLPAGVKVQKVLLTKLNWDKVKDDFKDDILGKERDWRLYEALKDRVRQYQGDVKKAFAFPFYKPVLDATKVAPIVRSVKIQVSGTSGIDICSGIADNGSMVKVLVYAKNEKYFLVPVYVADIVRTKSLKAIAPGKDESDWPCIDETFVYQFELYSNDLVYVKRKSDEFVGYYVKCNRANGQIWIDSHDRGKIFNHKDDRNWLISIGTVVKFEKLQVDVLGRHSRLE